MRLKKVFEMLFIFLLPLIILIFNFEFKKQNEYDSSNNLISSNNYIEFESPFSDYKDNLQYKNYLNFNQLIINGNFTTGDNWSALSGGSYIISSNVLSYSWFANYSRNGLGQTFNYIINHKYLCCATIKNNSTTESRTFTIGQSYGSYVSKTIEPNETDSVIGIITILQNSGQGYNDFAIGGYNAQLTYDANISNVMCIDLTQMFGEGYEPNTIQEIEQYIDLNNYIEYTLEPIELIYYSNNIISENYEYNFNIWGRFFNFLNKDLNITDNFILRFSVSYCMLAIINIFIWNLIFYTLTLLFKIIFFKRE